MWHSPNQRLRALAHAKKRERDRARRPFHVKRITAHLTLLTPSTKINPHENPDPPIPIRVVLNDLTPKGVGLFSQAALIAGQEVIMAISEPMKLDIRSRIIWCQEHGANSHVLSPNPFCFRLGVEFILPTTEDQQNVSAFWEEVCKNHLYSSSRSI